MIASTSLSSEAGSVLESSVTVDPGSVALTGTSHTRDQEKPGESQLLCLTKQGQEAQGDESNKDWIHETSGSLPIRARDGQESEHEADSGGLDAPLHDITLMGAHLDDPEVQSQHLSKQKLRAIVSDVRESQRERVQQRIDKARQDALSRFTTQATMIIDGMSQIQEKADELVKTAIDNEYRQFKADRNGDAQTWLENALAEHSVIEQVDKMLEDFSESMLPESQDTST
ncbi:hypothetical protein LZ30DRAFT_800504 [Colletotrichum cereale]|nr:hypothetical protein LZ30DRAFT_800504 [Colletotrichum cereale]